MGACRRLNASYSSRGASLHDRVGLQSIGCPEEYCLVNAMLERAARDAMSAVGMAILDGGTTDPCPLAHSNDSSHAVGVVLPLPQQEGDLALHSGLGLRVKLGNTSGVVFVLAL